jgi:hypothetical protein
VCSFCTRCRRVLRADVKCLKLASAYQYQTGIHRAYHSTLLSCSWYVVVKQLTTLIQHTPVSYCLTWCHKKAVSPINTEVTFIFLWRLKLVALLNSCMHFIIAVARRSNGWIAVGQDCLLSTPLLGHSLRYRGYSSTTDMCLPSPNFRHKVRFSSLYCACAIIEGFGAKSL